MIAVSQILPNFHYGFPGVIELQVLFIIKILLENNTEFPFSYDGRKSQLEMLSFKCVAVTLGI